MLGHCKLGCRSAQVQRQASREQGQMAKHLLQKFSISKILFKPTGGRETRPSARITQTWRWGCCFWLGMGMRDRDVDAGSWPKGRGQCRGCAYSMLERQQQLPGAINTDTGRPNENENKIEGVEDREWEYP